VAQYYAALTYAAETATARGRKRRVYLMPLGGLTIHMLRFCVESACYHFHHTGVIILARQNHAKSIKIMAMAHRFTETNSNNAF